MVLLLFRSFSHAALFHISQGFILLEWMARHCANAFWCRPSDLLLRQPLMGALPEFLLWKHQCPHEREDQVRADWWESSCRRLPRPCLFLFSPPESSNVPSPAVLLAACRVPGFLYSPCSGPCSHCMCPSPLRLSQWAVWGRPTAL